MNTRLAIGLLGAAIAGCAPSRSASPVASRPVGMEPVPSIHDTINRGTGDPAIQKATLAEARHPRWSGRFQPPRDPRTGAPAGGAPPAEGPAGTPPPGSRPTAPAVLASPSSPPIGSGPPTRDSADLATARESGPFTPQPSTPGGPPAPAGAPSELPGVEEPRGGAAEPTPAEFPPAAGAGSPAVSPRPDAPAGDPLLGPNPELMPAIDGPLSKPSPAGGPDQAPAPAAVPSEMPLEGAPLPPVDPQPARGSLESPTDSPMPAPAAPQASRPADHTVKLASYSTNALEEAIDREWREAGRSAARIGNEVITLHDLVLSVKEQLNRNPPGRSLSRDEVNMVAKSVLAGLIERSLIVQEAKRYLKNPKQLQRLQEAAEKYWREEELPPLMRKHGVETEYQLSQKLSESGRSLESLRQAYHQEFVAQVYLEQKFADRRKVELPEMLDYYQKHLNDREFHRPAQITWRELVVEKDRHPEPGAARHKADALLARLQRGEDFAALARAESEGPSRVRQEGGLMRTSPGSYAVEAVNQALAQLPLGQISPVLEGPTSLHIVRVEARRQAGPATFEEVQDQIRRRIQVEKITKARSEFLARLRRDTPVSTIFDGTESDPQRPQDD